MFSFSFAIEADSRELINFYNLLNRNECENYSQEDCEYLDYCEWVSDNNNPNNWGMCVEVEENWEDECRYFENEDECIAAGCDWGEDGCYGNWGEDGEDDGLPECLHDCDGLEYLGADIAPDELCDWIISINGNECIEDCEEEFFISLEHLSEACYNCLGDESLDCGDIFDDEDGDDGNDDDGWEEYPCSDLGYEDCLWVDYCEWISESPNMPGMCVDAGGDDWGDDGGFISICESFDFEECASVDFCEWIIVQDENSIVSMCVENNISPAEGCWEDGELYCYGCELFINDCQYYECTIEGWTELITIDDCGDFAGDEIGFLQLGNAYGFPGSTLEIDLHYKSLESIAGIQFTINDEPDWLYNIEFVSNDDCFEANSNDVDGNLIGIMFSFSGCTLVPSDEFLYFGSIVYELSPDAEYGEFIELDFSNIIVSGVDGNYMLFEGGNGVVTVGGLPGDVNQDSQVNVIDIVASVNFILQVNNPTDFEFIAADYNQDNELNVLDIVSMVNYILFGEELSQTLYSDETKVVLRKNTLVLQGDIGGIQFEGNLISNIMEPDILSSANQRNIIYNLNGKLETKNLEFISDPLNLIVADINGNMLNIVKIDDFKLNNAFPNPFNPVTELSYSIPNDSFIKLTVYDINGRHIETLINEFQSFGNYRINWKADNQPSGVYFVKFTADNFMETQRIMLIK